MLWQVGSPPLVSCLYLEWSVIVRYSEQEEQLCIQFYNIIQSSLSHSYIICTILCLCSMFIRSLPKVNYWKVSIFHLYLTISLSISNVDIVGSQLYFACRSFKKPLLLLWNATLLYIYYRRQTGFTYLFYLNTFYTQILYLIRGTNLIWRDCCFYSNFLRSLWSVGGQ